MIFIGDELWQEIKSEAGSVIQREWILPPDYGQNFDLIYLKADNSLAAGNHEIIVKVSRKIGRRIVLLLSPTKMKQKVIYQCL